MIAHRANAEAFHGDIGDGAGSAVADHITEAANFSDTQLVALVQDDAEGFEIEWMSETMAWASQASSSGWSDLAERRRTATAGQSPYRARPRRRR